MVSIAAVSVAIWIKMLYSQFFHVTNQLQLWLQLTICWSEKRCGGSVAIGPHISEGRLNTLRVKPNCFEIPAVLCYCLLPVRWSSVISPSVSLFLSRWLIWQLTVLSANVGVAILSPGACFALSFLSHGLYKRIPPRNNPQRVSEMTKGRQRLQLLGQHFMAWVITYILRPLC